MPEPDVTEPQLEVDDGKRARPAPAEGPPSTGFAPTDFEGASDEMPTDEHRVFEPGRPAGADLASAPAEGELELLEDDDLATLAPEIDLVDTDPMPTDEPATQGLFDAPGTDLSTLPDPDAPKKS
jgi:hypothetical protein